MSGSYISDTVSPAGNAAGPVSESTGCCSDVGRHSEEIAGVAEGFGSRGLAVAGDGESEQVIVGSDEDPGGCFDLEKTLLAEFSTLFRSDMVQNIRRGACDCNR